jgi:hypothetical protein
VICSSSRATAVWMEDRSFRRSLVHEIHRWHTNAHRHRRRQRRRNKLGVVQGHQEAADRRRIMMISRSTFCFLSVCSFTVYILCRSSNSFSMWLAIHTRMHVCHGNGRPATDCHARASFGSRRGMHAQPRSDALHALQLTTEWSACVEAIEQ